MFAPGPGWALLKAMSRAALQVSDAGPIIDVFADLMDFGKEVHQECRKEGIDQRMGQVLEDLAQLRFSLESEREALRALVAEVAVGRSERDQVDLVMMLSAVPGRVRHSLKRPADHSGLTTSPRQIAYFQQERGIGQLLPTRPPLFHPGDWLKANPDWELIELLGVGGSCRMDGKTLAGSERGGGASEGQEEGARLVGRVAPIARTVSISPQTDQTNEDSI